jgi:hypothetical protein
MAEAALAVGITTTLMRASYFTRTELMPTDGVGEPKPTLLRDPTLEDVERAVRQMRLFLRYVELLPGRSNNVRLRHELIAEEMRRNPDAIDFPAYRLRTISTGSLQITIDLAHWWLAMGPLGLVLLAEKISTFKPRVHRQREEDLLAAAKARLDRNALAAEAARALRGEGRGAASMQAARAMLTEGRDLEATVTALGRLLTDEGPDRDPRERGPDRIDLIDDDADELVEWNFPSRERND